MRQFSIDEKIEFPLTSWVSIRIYTFEALVPWGTDNSTHFSKESGAVVYIYYYGCSSFNT
jgi:hypothetical protein